MQTVFPIRFGESEPGNALHRMLKEEANKQYIDAVVSRWTRMEDRLRQP